MADTAPMTTYVPKEMSKEEKRRYHRIRQLHVKKKARAAQKAKAK